MLHFIGGEKGGVGKSLVARTIVQYLLDRGFKFSLFDADRSNPDVKRIYNSVGCRDVFFSEDNKYEDEAKPVYLAAKKNRTLLSLPSQINFALKRWFETNDIFEICQEDGVDFTYWFVCSGGYDSIELFDQHLAYYKGKVNHVLVKNWAFCDEWDSIFTMDSIIENMEKYEVKVVDFPKFTGDYVRNVIDQKSLTFGSARQYNEFDSIDRQRVKTFLKKAYSAFDDAGVFYMDETEEFNSIDPMESLKISTGVAI